LARPDKIYETHVVKISITIMARLNPCRWRKFHREVNYFKEEETSETPVVRVAQRCCRSRPPAVCAAAPVSHGRQLRVGDRQTNE